jgi:hypothetical protein
MKTKMKVTGDDMEYMQNPETFAEAVTNFIALKKYLGDVNMPHRLDYNMKGLLFFLQRYEAKEREQNAADTKRALSKLSQRERGLLGV